MQVFVIFLQLLVLYCTTGKSANETASTTATTAKPVKPIVEKKQAAKYENPNYVRDRLKSPLRGLRQLNCPYKHVMYKPEYPALNNRFKKPFHPSWMDYCDPYHCNAYHQTVCGLNRRSLRFKWFQSVCHLILNNQCSTYRGFLKYDLVENKFCTVYVMHLRSKCNDCDEEDDVPVCAVSSNSRVVLFKNSCAMDMYNCEKDRAEYQQVQMFLCEFYSYSLVK